MKLGKMVRIFAVFGILVAGLAPYGFSAPAPKPIKPDCKNTPNGIFDKDGNLWGTYDAAGTPIGTKNPPLPFRQVRPVFRCKDGVLDYPGGYVACMMYFNDTTGVSLVDYPPPINTLEGCYEAVQREAAKAAGQ